MSSDWANVFIKNVLDFSLANAYQSYQNLFVHNKEYSLLFIYYLLLVNMHLLSKKF